MLPRIRELTLFDKIQMRAIELAGDSSFLVVDKLTNVNLATLTPRPEIQGSISGMPELTRQHLILSSKYRIFVSYEGMPIFAGGVIEIYPTVAEGWLIVDENINKIPFKTFIKLMREYLDLLPYTRIQATVRAEFPAGHRFTKALGYQHEGILRKYGADGFDYHMYSRIKEN